MAATTTVRTAARRADVLVARARLSTATALSRETSSWTTMQTRAEVAAVVAAAEGPRRTAAWRACRWALNKGRLKADVLVNHGTTAVGLLRTDSTSATIETGAKDKMAAGRSGTVQDETTTVDNATIRTEEGMPVGLGGTRTWFTAVASFRAFCRGKFVVSVSSFLALRRCTLICCRCRPPAILSPFASCLIHFYRCTLAIVLSRQHPSIICLHCFCIYCTINVHCYIVQYNRKTCSCMSRLSFCFRSV